VPRATRSNRSWRVRAAGHGPLRAESCAPSNSSAAGSRSTRPWR
jgi:hypothetical protein